MTYSRGVTRTVQAAMLSALLADGRELGTVVLGQGQNRAFSKINYKFMHKKTSNAHPVSGVYIISGL